MDGCRSEGCTTDARNTKMEEKSWKYGRMEAFLTGGQDPEGAVAPYMDGLTLQQTLTYILMDSDTHSTSRVITIWK